MGYNLIILLPTISFCSGYNLAHPCNWSQKLQQEYKLFGTLPNLSLYCFIYNIGEGPVQSQNPVGSEKRV